MIIRSKVSLTTSHAVQLTALAVAVCSLTACGDGSDQSSNNVKPIENHTPAYPNQGVSNQIPNTQTAGSNEKGGASEDPDYSANRYIALGKLALRDNYHYELTGYTDIPGVTVRYGLDPKFKPTNYVRHSNCQDGKGDWCYHTGIDYRSKNPEPVYSLTDGVVVDTTDKFGTVTVKTGSTYITYMHLSAKSLKKGDYACKGLKIGMTGDTYAKGRPHLHIEANTKKAFLPFIGNAEGIINSGGISPLTILDSIGVNANAIARGNGMFPIVYSCSGANLNVLPKIPDQLSPGTISSPGSKLNVGDNNILRWNLIDNATYYNVRVRNLRTNKLIVSSSTSNNYTKLPRLDVNTKYSWNISACNNDGQCSSFSSVHYFYTTNDSQISQITCSRGNTEYPIGRTYDQAKSCPSGQQGNISITKVCRSDGQWHTQSTNNNCQSVYVPPKSCSYNNSSYPIGGTYNEEKSCPSGQQGNISITKVCGSDGQWKEQFQTQNCESSIGSVYGISPRRANLNNRTIFTIYGKNFPRTANFSVESCEGYTRWINSSRAQLICTPRGSTGNKRLYAAMSYKGVGMKNTGNHFIRVQESTPQKGVVYNISPKRANLNNRTIFTIYGKNFPRTANFSVESCEGYTRWINSSRAQLICTPRGSTGNKRLFAAMSYKGVGMKNTGNHSIRVYN